MMTLRASLRRAVPAGAAWMLAAIPWSAIGVPSEADAELPGIDAIRVAVPSAELDGHVVSIREVDSRLAPNEALAAVERHWRAQGGETLLRAEAGEWSVLSRPLAGANADEPMRRDPGRQGFETLQLRASTSGGSRGLFTRWHPRLPGSPDLPGLAGLLPSDAQVVRRLRSRDSGMQTAQTLIAHLNRTLEDSEAHLDRHLAREGFAPMDSPGARALRWSDDRARFYRSAGVELLVTLHRQREGTDIVMYQIERTR